MTWAALVVGAGVLAGCGSRMPAMESAPTGPTASRSYVPAEAQLGELPALYSCNKREVVVGRVGQLARVTLGPEQVDLLPVPRQSGQRFVGQDGDAVAPSTAIEVHTDSLSLQWAGRALGPCDLIRWLPSTFEGQGHAAGHLGGWQFRIDAHGARLQWDAHGQQPGSVEAIKLNPGQALALGKPFQFGDAVVSSAVTVTQEVCVDGRTEWPRPYRVEVRRDGQTWVGCGGSTLSLLQSKPWTHRSATPAQSKGTQVHTATLRFDAAGQLTGDTGCNRFQSAYRLDGNFLKLQQPATTRKSCLGTVMEFEKSLLEWLPKVSRFQLAEGGELLLLTADGRSFAWR
jgi:heat shock protein HslJ